MTIANLCAAAQKRQVAAAHALLCGTQRASLRPVSRLA
jgi:hypothetical protein